MKNGSFCTPEGLLGWLAKQPTKREVCIECGAGFGELAAYFSGQFQASIATDISPPTQSRYGIKVVKAAAEKLPAADQSVDLLVSMQALHHFDIDAHLAEARRVLRPGAVFAALSWGPIVLPAKIATAFRPTFRSIEPYWEAGRSMTVSGYADLPPLGRKIAFPKAARQAEMTIPQLEAEIARWSSTQAALAADAVIADPDLSRLRHHSQPFQVRWPILGQVFRI